VSGLTSGCTGQHLTGGAGERYTSSTEVVDARCGPLGESHRLFLKHRVELPLDLHGAVITYLLPCSLSDRLHNVTHQIQSRPCMLSADRAQMFCRSRVATLWE
jgi:hypothetical protein